MRHRNRRAATEKKGDESGLTPSARALRESLAATPEGQMLTEYQKQLLLSSQEEINERLAAGDERPLSFLLEGLTGVIDSREPFERPRREPDASGRSVIEKLERQGLKLPDSH